MWNHDHGELLILLSNNKVFPQGLFKHTPTGFQQDTHERMNRQQKTWKNCDVLMRPEPKAEMITRRHKWSRCQIANTALAQRKGNCLTRLWDDRVWKPASAAAFSVHLQRQPFDTAGQAWHFWAYICQKHFGRCKMEKHFTYIFTRKTSWALGSVMFEHVQGHVQHKWTGNH